MQESPIEIRLIKPGADPGSQAISEVLGSGDLQDDDVEVAPFFSLEYQLRDFIASNLGTIMINGRRLRLYVDATGRDGVEFPTAVGPIDISGS